MTPPKHGVRLDTRSAEKGSNRGKRKKNPIVEVVKIAVGGVVGIVIAVLILNFGFDRDLMGIFGGDKKRVADERPIASSDAPDAGTSRVVTSPAPQEGAGGSHSGQIRPPARTLRVPAPAPGEASGTPAKASDGASSTGDRLPPDPLANEPERFDAGNANESFEPDATRERVPALAGQTAARRKLETQYQTNKLDSKPEKQQMANRLLADSSAQETISRLDRFVMLRRASELASEAGDASLMVLVVDQMADGYVIDALKAKSMLLKPASRAIDNRQESMDGLVAVAKTLIDQSREAERLDLALSVADTTVDACVKNDVGEKYRDYVAHGRNVLQTVHTHWVAYQEAKVSLQQDANDAEAHLIVGRWYCLQRGKWPRGLSHLAQGADGGLKALAQRDLACTNDSDSQDIIGVADAWYAVGGESELNAACLARAYYWYERALPQVSGADKQKVETRIKAIAKAYYAPGAALQPK